MALGHDLLLHASPLGLGVFGVRAVNFGPKVQEVLEKSHLEARKRNGIDTLFKKKRRVKVSSDVSIQG